MQLASVLSTLGSSPATTVVATQCAASWLSIATRRWAQGPASCERGVDAIFSNRTEAPQSLRLPQLVPGTPHLTARGNNGRTSEWGVLGLLPQPGMGIRVSACDSNGRVSTFAGQFRCLHTTAQQHEGAQVAHAPAQPTLDFSSSEAIFAGQRSTDLLRSWLVFRLCGIPLFVSNAPVLLKVSYTLLGKALTNWLVKKTFFAQFCAGETDQEVLARAKQLEARGIFSILDYAAEDDVSSSQPEAPKAAASPPKPSGPAGFPASPKDEVVVDTDLAPAAGIPMEATQSAVARQYAYANEQQCDAHVAIFLSAISAAAKMPGQGFAAVKLTGLGNPRLLERVSSAIREVRGVFSVWDTNGNGTIDTSEFESGYQRLFPDATDDERARVFAWMDTQKDGQVDYVSWCQRLSLTRMPEYAARIHVEPPEALNHKQSWQASLQSASLTEEEVKLLRAMRGRLERIANAAASQNVKLMIDAEHTYFQPCIDHVTLQLMRRYNGAGQPPIIYNTYQAYLTDSYQRLTVDLERARREGYVLGAKLVRGAYLDLERGRAASMGYASPVWDSLADTHANYARCMQELLRQVKAGRAEVMLGTHNQESIEQAVGQMASLGMNPRTTPVFFGQLLGMSDHLTLVLGQSGYRAYKYVPYGLVDQVIPYLLRRAAENAAVMQGTKKDLVLLQHELSRRAKVALGMRG